MPDAASLKILHVLRAPVGGLFRHVIDLAQGQVARGHRVGIVAAGSGGTAQGEEQIRALTPQLALGMSRIPMERQLGLGDVAAVRHVNQRIAATTACHAAVKANYPLTYEKMTHILDELRATAYSTVCPHGRPVMLRLTRREIEKNFDRI